MAQLDQRLDVEKSGAALDGVEGTEHRIQRLFIVGVAFEAQQVETGTNIIKLFVHITQETQDEQLAQRLDTPWKRWKTGTDDYRNRARRAEYWDAMHDMFEKTDTKQAPWKVIDNNNRKAGRIAALTYVAERLEKLVPMDFPAPDPEVIKLAREAFGYKPAK